MSAVDAETQHAGFGPTLATRPTGGTVLLVEDEESIGSLVRTYLERDGYRVVWVRTGEEALAEVRATRSGSSCSTSASPVSTGSRSAAGSAPARWCRS
jgi:PleD family two-component response regulator